MKQTIAGVVSLDLHRGMGYRGDILVRLKADMKWFRNLTTEHDPDTPLPAVVMGRKTWDSLPVRNRPLPSRRNYILTHHPPALEEKEGVVFGSNWDSLLSQAQKSGGKVFIIGGAEIFKIALPDMHCLYVTEFRKEFSADTFFPPFKEEFPIRQVLQSGEENGIEYEMIFYRRSLER